jgi:parallel beta-helix repeat protein
MLDKLRNAVLVVVGGLVAVWAISALVGVVQGGPLDPPGPPAETTIRLNGVRGSAALWPEDMPFNLDHSGSYHLAGDLHLEDPGTNGITISADNVTLDLNGFALIGPGKTVGSDDGVHILGDGVSIVNGTVREWGGSGVYAGSGADNGRYQDLHLVLNGGSGLGANDRSTVVGCIATDNGSDGISVQYYSLIIDSVSSSNGGDGIWARSGTVSNCVAASNTGNGIEAWTNTLVTGNVADYNTVGIHVTGSGNRIEGNNATDNDMGIDVDSGGNLIIKNSWADNTSGYHFAANNTYGEIVTSTGQIAAGPWANFQY